ncbi:hypothetical protein [Mycolicibacterium septicum]|uniref:hypothetical protein n=1 Tax=Mycolicibacterium septicum TaxID=98668 RepID=UPI001AF8D5F1|nr:hypothetical protein [Mycolicibacterium septicum]QRY51811.1 hypothetical protein JVX95_31305 [Mycolicibacterium septicum]
MSDTFSEVVNRACEPVADTPFAWVCYTRDIEGTHIGAIFPDEIDALRHAVGSYLKVAPIGVGEIGDLP